MYITLKMTIQDQEISLDVNLTNRAGRIYRQQYNRDLLKDMSDIYKKLHRSMFAGIDLKGVDLSGKTEAEISAEIMKHVDLAEVLENQETAYLDFEESERAGQVIWAFVKNKAADIPNYEEWIDSFDFILPVGEIVNALYDAWHKSAQPTVELKN